MPSYDGATPSKDGSAQYTYNFSGWSPEVTTVTGDATYTAQFSDAVNSYTVTWKNYDGTILEVDNVAYGAMPSYDGATPSKDGNAQYTYTFSGWSPSIVAVTSDATYYAEFIETERPITKGDTYQFGTYPQSMVIYSTILSRLNAASGTLPTSENSQKWTDYGYYIKGSVSSYMWYIDIRDETDEYRGVYFTSYRPYDTAIASSTSGKSYQPNNGYDKSHVYWFKYEPITWRVLDVQSNRAFLMADLVLDSQDYHYSWAERPPIDGRPIHPNNYEHSHIRSWLNDNFYNTAFSTEEKARIQTTIVDNSDALTANTSDKVFLLSYAEATNASYGLSTDASRQLHPSRYAQSQGVYTDTSHSNYYWWLSNGISYWWLRSPNHNSRTGARNVNYDGEVRDNYDVYYNDVRLTSVGVGPALWISL